MSVWGGKFALKYVRPAAPGMNDRQNRCKIAMAYNWLNCS